MKNRGILLFALTLALGFSALACSGDGNGSPTAPNLPPELVEPPPTALQLQGANLLVGGQPVSGTLPVGHGMGQTAVFEGTLMMGQMPAPGYEVWVEFDRPMGMMGPHHGRFRLYDDGTHGDPVAGDGIYCFEDFQRAYACNGNAMMPGEYHYQFYGVHADGHETNRMHVRIHLTQQ